MSDIDTVASALAFFASAIKSGEDWSPECDRAKQAAVEALRRLSWRSIDTAPRDGTVVLICGNGLAGYYVADAKWDGEWHIFNPDTDNYTEPSFGASHWMPLPARPSGTRRG